MTGIIIFVLVLALLLYCPIFKPWFGFREPKIRNGKWGE